MRIGTLGAARITPPALIAPAAEVAGVTVAAVAAREVRRAEAFAREHGVATVHASYAALVGDESIDAVYNPLPNSAHAEWTFRALEAGKHVLCEKPMALNAAEAEQMVAEADRRGLVLMEAFHWRFHPAAARLLELAARLAPLERGEAVLLGRIEDEGDIRYQLALGGGATMDVGCYCLHALRTLSGEEPEVLEASGEERPPGVDVSMDAVLRFPSGLEARMACSLAGPPEAGSYVLLEGMGGRLRMENPFAPQTGNRLTAELADGSSIDEQVTRRSTYSFQLEAFVAAVESGGPRLTGDGDAVANMRAIDAVYGAAGLPPR